MSIASQDTYLNLTTPLSVVGSGGSGPGSVDAIVSGANISTIGASVGDVTVALQDNIANISSIAFNAGGALTNVSTINGAPVGGAVSVPPNISVSSIAFRGFLPSSATSMYTYEVDGTTNLDVLIDAVAQNAQSYLTLEAPGTIDTFPQLSIGVSQDDGAGVNPRDAYIDMRPSTLRIVSSSEIDLIAPNVIMPSGTLRAAAAAITTLTAGSATLSTLALSTIGAIVAASAGNVQTFNTIIGNIRLQGGVVSTTSAGVPVSWTAFSTVPIILTGCTGTIGAGTAVVLQGGGESGVNISVNTGTTTEVYWLAIGAV